MGHIIVTPESQSKLFRRPLTNSPVNHRVGPVLLNSLNAFPDGNSVWFDDEVIAAMSTGTMVIRQTVLLSGMQRFWLQNAETESRKDLITNKSLETRLHKQ